MASIADIGDAARGYLDDYCDPKSRYAWPAYDTDLEPTRLQPLDAAAPALLSYPIKSELLQRLHAEDGSEYARLWSCMKAVVAHPDAHQTRFEDVPVDSLDAEEAEGPWGTVIEAWRACQATSGLKMVAVTKILHRKVPDLVPIRDALLDRFYGVDKTGELFRAIHADVKSHADLLDELRRDRMAGGRPMTRLRALDIAIWMNERRQSGDQEEG